MLPLVVITELEGKRHHPELGWFARQSLRMLDELRIKHGRLDQPVPVNDAAARCASSSTTPTRGCCRRLPQRLERRPDPSVALDLAAEGRDVTLVSKDMPLRVKAASVGLAADEYRHGQASDPTWTGMAELERRPRNRSASCTRVRRSSRRTARAALPHRPGAALRPRLGAGPGATRTRRCGWSAATGRRSACAAGPPSSGSRWTSCSTTRSASSRSAAGPAPASRLSRCARASRR